MASKIDGVHSFEPTQKNQKSINMFYDSQIVENYAAGKVIDTDDVNTLASIQDSKGNPITLILKKNKELVVVQKTFNAEESIGYIERTIGGYDNQKILSFGVNQNLKTGDYSIAVTKETNNESHDADVYITKPLSNDSSQIASAFLSLDKDFWNHRGSIQLTPGDIVTQVLVGDFPLEEEDNESPGIFIATSEKNKAYYYIVDSNLENETPDNPQKMSLGDTSTHIIDFKIGKKSYFEGIYTLQNINTNRYLRFHGFPINGEPGPSTLLHTFRNNEEPNSIEVISEEDYNSGVYVGGNGLYYLSSKAQQTKSEEDTIDGIVNELPLEVLIKAKNAKGIRKMTLREDKNKVTLWALNGSKQMMTCEQKKTSISGYSISESKEWLDPIVVAHDVHGWAAIRNLLEETNDLMILRPGNKLSHLIQDSNTTNYRHTDIPLNDEKFMQNYSSYSTQLTFQDKDGFAHITIDEDDKGFGISASEWCEVNINGLAYEMRPKEITFIKTDMQGFVTLVHKADSISPPIFKVIINGKDKVVNPAQKVDKKLASIEDGPALKNEKWVDENGKKHDLISKSVKDKDLNAAVEGIHNFETIRKDLPSDGSISATYLDMDNLKSNNRPVIWGMRISPNGVINYFEENEVLLNMGDGEKQSWWEKAIERAAGNVLEWMKGIARDFVEIVVKAVKGAWKIAIQIGKVAYSFVVKCLGHLYNGLNWLLDKALGIDLEKIRKWIGFVFNMKEVREAHKIVSHITKEIPVYARLKLKGLNSEVNSFFEKLIKDVDKLKEVDHAFAKQGYSESKNRIVKENMNKDDVDSMDNILKSPAGNFMNYHVGHQGQHSAPGAEALFNNGEIQLFLEENKDVISEITNELKKLEGPLQEMGKNLVKITSGQLSLNQAIKLIVGDTLKLILACAKTVTNLIFKLIDGLLILIQKLATESIHIPFLTPLAQFILGNLNAKLSAVDHLTLPLVMPVVLMYKVLFHSNSEDPVFDKDGMSKILNLKGEALIDYLCKPQSTLDRNATIDVLSKILPIGGVFNSFVGRSMGLVSALVEAPVFTIIDFCLGVVGLLMGIPIGNINAYTIINSVISSIQIFIGSFPTVGGIFNVLADSVKGILSLIKLILDLDSSKKPAVLIWGGLNDLLGIITSILLAATGLAKYPKVQGPLAFITSGLISAEFFSGLTYSIVDAAVPDSRLNN